MSDDKKLEPVAFEVFQDWLEKEMPFETVIGDPKWWARHIYKRIFRAAPPVSEKPVLVSDAMAAIVGAMHADSDYAWSWHCNIAMAFVDAGGDRYTANQGAARFMKILANVEPAHELPAEKPGPAAFIQPDHLDKARRAPFLCRVEPTQRKADFIAIYTALPAREWVGLTDEELAEMHHLDQFGLFCDADEFHDIARAIEAKLKAKNT